MNSTVNYQNINNASEQTSSMLSYWPAINTNDNMPESNHYKIGLLAEKNS